MFEEKNLSPNFPPNPSGSPEESKPVEDIFATNEGAPPAPPVSPSSSSPVSPLPTPPPSLEELGEEPGSGGGKKWLLITVITILALGVIGGAAYLLVQSQKSEEPAGNTNVNSSLVNQNLNKNLNTNISLNLNTNEFTDTDTDGLSDQEESVLGTDYKSSDTDSDGLSDYDEVKVYETDPLNPDTDNDNYTDGEEVKNNYNPKGKGVLRNINEEIEKLLNANLNTNNSAD